MKIRKETLPNGMTVLLEENHAAPVISFNILVKAGSAFETDEEAGICHVIEHMIFKGTPTRPVGSIAGDIEAAGGEVNAYTSFDQTVFYINMASRYADKGLEILADAVQNSLFDQGELTKEAEVICEEIRRSNDNPSHRVGESLFKHAYTKHTYGRPIIGFDKTVKSFTSEKLKNFYRLWYSPENMTCIVVGDFESDAMLEKIKSAFSKRSSGVAHSSMNVMIGEPPQTALNVNVNYMDAQTVYFTFGFHVPEITHEDIPALDMLGHILAGVYSSRLEQEVKEKKRLVHNIYSYAFTPRYPGLFIIGGTMQASKASKAVEAIWDEIEKISTEPASAAELNRAKINIRSSEIYERETVGGEAAKLAYFLATAGDHEFERRYFQIINDITAENVRSAAQKYLQRNNCTISMVAPREDSKIVTAQNVRVACKPKKAHILAKKATAIALPPKIYHLKNGAKLVIRENHTLPIISIYGAMKGGLRYETPANNGISHLTSHSLSKGTEVRSAIEIAKKIESIAGFIGGYYGRNAIGLRTEFLSEKLYDGFGLFAEVLTKPLFDKKEVAKEKVQQLDDIKNQEDSLSSLAFMQFTKSLYGNHPYGLKMLGERKSVKDLTPAALKRYWQRFLNPKQLVISVAGDVCPDEIRELAERWIVMGKGAKSAEPKPIKIHKPESILITETKKKGREQAHIVLGYLGSSIKSEDHYKLVVLNNILSGQGGRLFVSLRDKMSLAYAINSVMHSSVEPGYLAVYIGTEASKVDTAIGEIKKELRKLQTELVDIDELNRAQQHLVGTYELDQQRNASLASNYSFYELYGLGIKKVEDYPKDIMKVTRKDILETAKKYIDLDAYVLSIIRPA